MMKKNIIKKRMKERKKEKLKLIKIKKKKFFELRALHTSILRAEPFDHWLGLKLLGKKKKIVQKAASWLQHKTFKISLTY